MPISARMRAVPDDDPVQARSDRAVRAFSVYLRWYFQRNFHAVRISRRAVPSVGEGRPIIICCNHPGWWDPVLFILLMHILMPNRAGYGPMDAAALRRYGVLRKMGVFGIDPETRGGGLRFLRAGMRILSEPRSVLWVSGQGAFTDPRLRPVRLRRGIAHLARHSPKSVILPLALEYPFWNERRPEALLHFGPPVEADAAASVGEWTTLLEAALSRTLDELAAMSITRDPALFTELVRGRTGVGGIYDLWRHGTATLAGRRFNPAHEA